MCPFDQESAPNQQMRRRAGRSLSRSAGD
ncbi:hypothetical protein GGP85_003326, partial [Salinibacter ruber]|nr:hypothetical protein [Salinibacter ruber]